MLLSAIVTLLTLVLYYFVMGARVGMLRARLNIKAPAISGHPDFERAFRVHANTGEQYIAFLPALWLATALFHPLYWLPAAFGDYSAEAVARLRRRAGFRGLASCDQRPNGNDR